MAGEPALDKVLTALRSTLDAAAALDGVTVEIDRADDDALGRGELPHLNIHHGGTTFEMLEHSIQTHRATVDLDMGVETKAASTIGRRLRDMEANIVATLYADRTLGGLVQDIVLLSTGGDEDMQADVGVRSVSILIVFLTPLGDHRTVLGASGPIP